MDDCTSVSLLCPVEATIYGYTPNLGANAFFLAGFAVLLFAQIFLGIKYRTWTWLIAMSVGCTFEVLGYVARLIQNNNPWNETGFLMQIACLIIGPSFMSGSIDLVLKHVVLTFGGEYSRIPARLYTWLFIGADALSIVLQAVGGGMASATNSPVLFNAGNKLMLAGIIIQVVQLVLFGAVSAEYGIRTWKYRAVVMSASSMDKKMLTRFKWFAASCTIAYITILTRCAYRQGWGGALMCDEPSFLALDGAMILIASIVLTIFHPGIFFPQLGHVGNSATYSNDIEM